ncbi:MAG: putative PEP-CTERM system TPR-repeat lipoprotein [Ulvibacter sp.]|jgi:putative PEP-CTERM system TPR-repeat lipoprotein
MKKITGSVIVIITLIFVSGCNTAPSSERLLSAHQEYKNKNYPAVIIQLKNLIRDEPQNKEARLLMAKSQYQLGNFLNAEKEFIRSIELGTELEELSHYYINTLYAIEDHIGITNFWEENNSKLTKLSRAEIAPIISLAFLHQTKRKNSFEVATLGKNLAIEIQSPELIMINTAVANSYNQPADIDKTIKELSESCESYPTRWIICNLLGNALFSEKRFNDAAQVLEGILQQKPNHTLLVLKLADSYIKSGNNEKADLYVNELLKKYPDQPFVNLLAASIELRKENFETSLNHINSSMNSGLVTPQAKLIAGIVHYYLGNDEQALYHIQGLRNAFPNNPLITKLYVSLQLRLGDINSIKNAYSESSPSEENSEIFALASLEFLKSGDSKKSTELLQEIDISLIKNQKILNSVSLIKLATGDNSGINDLENSLTALEAELADRNDISKVKILLISSLLANNEKEKALNYVNDWIIKSPNTVVNKLLLIQIERKNKNMNDMKIEKIFNEILEIAPNNEEANLFYGQKNYLNNEFTKATKYYAEVITTNKFNLLAIQGYYYSQKKLNNASQALTYLEGKFKNIDGDFLERLTLAQFYLLTNQPIKTIDLLEGITAENNTLKAQTILAEAYFENNDFEQAISIYEEQLKKNNINMQLISKLAIAYEKSGNLHKATSSFETLKLSYPNNTQIGLVLANFQLFDNKQAESIIYIESLTEQQQNHPAVIGLKGKAYYFSNMYAQALPLLEKSYIETTNSKLIPFIFDTKIKQNKVNEALTEMEIHLKNHPNEVENRIYYANELNKHDKNKAMSQYAQIILNDESNLLALNNLAWLLYEAGNISEAKKYIDKALKIAPNNPDVIDTNNKINQSLNR